MPTGTCSLAVVLVKFNRVHCSSSNSAKYRPNIDMFTNRFVKSSLDARECRRVPALDLLGTLCALNFKGTWKFDQTIYSLSCQDIQHVLPIKAPCYALIDSF